MSKLATLRKGTEAWYEEAFRICTYDKGEEKRIRAAAKRVLAGKEKYMSIFSAIGMPWYLIGGFHNMESSCDFRAVLHNGERIIGTGKKTKLVPKGRGPFKTWEEAAIDALTIKNYARFKGAWTLGLMLQKAEEYNGLGYLKYHQAENSPYLWACTSLNDGTGKYTSDGKWSDTAPTNGQVGIAAIFKMLEEVKAIEIPRGVA